jgi:hypothetical protein
MDANLAKSLTELIDETLEELEDLRKSRFDAEEIDMGSDANGSMKMKKKEEDDEDDEDEDEEEKAEKSDDEDEDDEDEDEEEKAEKSDDEDEDDEDEDEEEKIKKAEMACAKAEDAYNKAKESRKKAEKKRDSLYKKMGMSSSEMKKSKTDSKIQKLEKTFKAKIAEMTDAINRIADQPVYARGTTYRDFQPLAKSTGDYETLSKTRILGELVSLKKSGRDISTDDVLRAELGGQSDLQEIANKYSIK